MFNVNVTQCRKCAFCTHWYDPANTHIQPKAPRINVWSYDEKASAYCEVKKHDMRATMFCSEYTCKI